MKPTGYRDNVGAILRRPDGLILMAERIDLPGIWQFPQGGVDPGESREDALWRELSEELGLASPKDVCTIIGQGPPTRYDFPEGYDAPVARKYRGQEQTLFVLEFSGVDADFRLDAYAEPEFRSVAWVTVDTAHARLWEFKRAPFERALSALQDLLR